MTTEVMTFNEFIADVVQFELINYVQDNIADMYPEDEFDEETNNYMEGNYQVHLEYLIETWKNSIDENFVHDPDFEIDYEYKGTFNELWDHFVLQLAIPFDYNWLHDIFERKILVTNVCLK
jgi:hypothetical protein